MTGFLHLRGHQGYTRKLHGRRRTIMPVMVLMRHGDSDGGGDDGAGDGDDEQYGDDADDDTDDG